MTAAPYDTSTSVVNQAIQYIGDNQPDVTGVAPLFDSSPAGVAAAKFYLPVVQSVGRQFEWDFARNTQALVASGNVAPFPWAFEYLYPANCIELWQVAPTTLADPNNPLPPTWVVANNLVGGVQRKVVQTNLAAALAIYNNYPAESTWDPLFREAVVRLLASELAMAVSGKPDVSQGFLQSGGAFEKIAESRDS